MSSYFIRQGAEPGYAAEPTRNVSKITVGQYKCTEVPTAAERTWKSCDQIKIKAEGGISTYDVVKTIYEEMIQKYEDSDIDWNCIHDAGCTIDDTELPHHITSQPDLERLMNITFSSFLNVLPREPIIVTMSRSTEDDYCPIEDVDQIQSSVLELLTQRLNSHVEIQACYDGSYNN
ncbi:hypothetical protein M0802_002999 [Mischocyttarus mexicanus]|nr:hypothetical protein M0802_002999 [Mischocyttarus mexicanus]